MGVNVSFAFESFPFFSLVFLRLYRTKEEWGHIRERSPQRLPELRAASSLEAEHKLDLIPDASVSELRGADLL